MTIGVSIFLIAVGAILRYATNFDVQDVSVDTVGLILMIAGAAGLVLSFVYEFFWAKRRREDARLEAERQAAYRQQQAYQQPPAEQQEYREPPRY
jgi:hypothetical protein